MGQRVTTNDGWAEVRSNGVVVVRVRAHVRRSNRRVNMAVFDIIDSKVVGGGWAQFHEIARGLAEAALTAHLRNNEVS